MSQTPPQATPAPGSPPHPGGASALPPPAAAVQPGAGDAPDWARESWELALRELELYRDTVWRFLRHPQRSADLWGRGALRALNPLGFLATSMGVVGVVRTVGLSRMGLTSGDSLAAQLLSSVGPFLHYAAFGLVCHLVLRALSPRRRRVSDSLGITMYAAGGPGAVVEVLVWSLVLALATLAGPGQAMVVLWMGLGVALGAFCNALGGGLGVLHGSRGWHMIVAFAVALVATGLFFGAVDPPGQYGVHWVLRLFDPEGGLRVRLLLDL